MKTIGSNLLKWIIPGREWGKGNRYSVKIQLPSAAVALDVWKQLGKGDGKTHIILDAEGFWLKKVNVTKCNDKTMPLHLWYECTLIGQKLVPRSRASAEKVTVDEPRNSKSSMAPRKERH